MNENPIVRFAVERRVTMAMAVLGVLVLGWLSLNRLPLEFLPTFAVEARKADTVRASPCLATPSDWNREVRFCERLPSMLIMQPSLAVAATFQASPLPLLPSPATREWVRSISAEAA